MSNAMILSSPDSSRSPSPERGPAVDPTTEAAKVRDKPIDRRTAGAATLRRDDERPAGGGGMQRLVLKVSNDDAAFILGKGGSTKRKIERVSSAQLSLNEKTLSLSIIGSPEAVGRAKDYVNMVLKQRVGPVHLNFDEARDDLTFVNVPVDSVGFVTGRNGSALRSAESEWGTLMFFAKHRLESKRMESPRMCVGLRGEDVGKFDGGRSMAARSRDLIISGGASSAASCLAAAASSAVAAACSIRH